MKHKCIDIYMHCPVVEGNICDYHANALTPAMLELTAWQTGTLLADVHLNGQTKNSFRVPTVFNGS
jgi:hypothetical protein